MKLAVTGASGLIGGALVPRLESAGHQVLRLVRRAPVDPGEARWDPETAQIDSAALEGVQAVVHLAGEPIGPARWTARKKNRILRSRVTGTSLLASALERLRERPRVLLSASAIGYYGDRGADWVDEGSPPGNGFLADLCREWEAATEPAEAAGIRVARLRTGVVLSRRGGALRAMVPSFRLGLGGLLGTGRQYMSWVALDDVLRAIEYLLESSLMGPVNLVTPFAVTNAELTRALARLLRRPAVLPVPGFLLRALLGEFADEGLLASTRVRPRRLIESGFEFEYPELEGALTRALRER